MSRWLNVGGDGGAGFESAIPIASSSVSVK